jgi:uncharacterized protein (DUF58 family)
MLTSRGWWFLSVVSLQCLLGVVISGGHGGIVAIVGFSLLAWFSYEWFRFRLRVQMGPPRLIIRRSVIAGGRSTPVLWSGQQFDVRVDLLLDSPVRLSYLTLQDRPPSGCERVSGDDNVIVNLGPEESATIEYRLRCDMPGEIRFEGIRVQFADAQGFFYHRRFTRQAETFLVLPPLLDAEGSRRTTKSHNILPPPGLHRLRQPGGGSELHDLRDYRPGDPPRMIAWKTSARRDRLITKEFESDVPVRCTLLLDGSASVRLGPPRETMLRQLTTVASGVAQAALSDRDHVGLVLFDEASTEIVAPARGSRHLIDMLHRLARVNSAAPISPTGDVDALLALANPLAHELYPDLMDRRVNRVPFGMFWRPLFDSGKFWVVFILGLPLMIVVAWFLGVATTYFMGRMDELRWLLIGAIETWKFFGSVIWPLLAAVGLAVLALLFWLAYGLVGQFPGWHTPRMRRKRLSMLFATLDHAPPGTETRYLRDDDAFARRAQEFLARHHRRYPIRLFDPSGRYLFRAESKIDVAARALVRLIAHGKDNELFVLLADLFELQNDLGPLTRALRIARARHHQVVVIAPWMPGVPIVDEEMPADERAREFRRQALAAGFRGVEAQLYRHTAERYHAAFRSLRQELGKAGVSLLRARQRDSVRLILNRMDRLRGARARR